MESYYEKLKEIDTLKQSLYMQSLNLMERLKKLFESKKITEPAYKSGDLILSMASYNLGLCSKRYTLTGLKKIQKRFNNYDNELKAIEK